MERKLIMTSGDQKPIIIFDTNAVNNKDFRTFFGSQQKLIKLSKRCLIVFPKIVIEEIARHKERTFSECFAKIEDAGLTEYMKVCDERMNAESAQLAIAELQKKAQEDIGYITIDVRDYDGFMRKMRPLAVRGDAPFGGKDDNGKSNTGRHTDCGIKDALVVGAIDDYPEFQENRGRIILCTDDNRLASCFSNIAVVEKVDDLMGLLDNPEKLQALYGLRKIIYDLACARSFKYAHTLIGVLSSHIKEFSRYNLSQLINAAMDNNQIYWIGDDPDVRGFYEKICNMANKWIDVDTKKRFTELMGEGYFSIQQK